MLIHLAAITGIVCMVSFLSFAYFIIERKILAKSQQRLGPNRTDYFGFFQGFSDFYKLISKQNKNNVAVNKYFFAFAYVVLIALPYIFYVLLQYPSAHIQKSYTNILSIFVLLFLFITTDSLFIFSTDDNRKRLKIKRNSLLSLLGLTIFLFACITPLSYVGMGPLIDLYFLQKKSILMFLMFSDPCAFLSSVLAFISFFFIIPSSPIGNETEDTFNGFWLSGYLLSRKIWIINLFSLWISIYAGGFFSANFSIFSLLFYFFKLSVLVILFLILRKMIPLLKVNDSIAFALNRLLPAGCIIAILQIMWVILV